MPIRIFAVAYVFFGWFIIPRITVSRQAQVYDITLLQQVHPT